MTAFRFLTILGACSLLSLACSKESNDAGTSKDEEPDDDGELPQDPDEPEPGSGGTGGTEGTEGEPGAVTVHVRDGYRGTIRPELQVMLSDPDGTFVETKLGGDTGTVTFESVKPGSYITAATEFEPQIYTLETVANVQPGWELEFGNLSWGDDTEVGQINLTYTDAPAGTVSFEFKTPNGSYSTSDPSYVTTVAARMIPDGTLTVLAIAKDANDQVLGYCVNTVEATGTAPDVLLSGSFSNWTTELEEISVHVELGSELHELEAQVGFYTPEVSDSVYQAFDDGLEGETLLSSGAADAVLLVPPSEVDRWYVGSEWTRQWDNPTDFVRIQRQYHQVSSDLSLLEGGHAVSLEEELFWPAPSAFTMSESALSAEFSLTPLPRCGDNEPLLVEYEVEASDIEGASEFGWVMIAPFGQEVAFPEVDPEVVQTAFPEDAVPESAWLSYRGYSDASYDYYDAVTADGLHGWHYSWLSSRPETGARCGVRYTRYF